MSSKAFNRIAEGLGEALAVARKERVPFRLHVSDDITIRTIRTRLGMTQEGFASCFGFTIAQIRDWEQGRARPLGGVRAYLMMIDKDPEGVLVLLRASQKDGHAA